MNETPFQAFMVNCQQRVEKALDKYLPSETLPPARLHAAMRHSTLGGGKRIRPILVYATGQALNIQLHELDSAAAAVELIHAYSLIHDDLPAMDDDDLRRGLPTCHKAFDEATAILAGDALQTLAFQCLCGNAEMEVSADKRIQMIETLSRASGSRGMAGGQSMDLEATGEEQNLAQLENMHIHKTGALIRASVRLGTLFSASVSEETEHHLDHYAKCIGLAFQIHDDILDVESDTQTLGKTQGKDHAQEKSTYPGLLGLNEAKEKAQELHQQALLSLSHLGESADSLRSIANYIIDRDH